MNKISNPTVAQPSLIVAQPSSTVAQQVAQAASAFEERRTGRVPKSVTVVLTENTLVITVHGALSEAEKAAAKHPAGAAQVQEFHRQLFANSADWLRQEIKRITGAEVREATAEVETTTGTVVQAFTTGTMVQVYLLAHNVPADTWSGNGQDGRKDQGPLQAPVSGKAHNQAVPA